MEGKIAILLFLTFLVSVLAQDEPCKCMSFHLCKDNDSESGATETTDAPKKKKKPLIDPRMKPDECENYMDVCCKPEDVLNTTLKERPSSHPCGTRNLEGIEFRIKGTKTETQFGEFSWMTAVFFQDSTKKHNYKCGGSLIHPSVVLTATHCVIDKGSYMVRVGEWDSQTKKEVFKHQNLKVKEVQTHPKYDPDYLSNDAALLFLERSIVLTDHINVICLPPPNFVALDADCVVTGWGKENFEQKSIQPNILKAVELPMMSKRDCRAAFKKTRLGDEFDLDNTFVCAGGKIQGQDACTGDGGGPLICPIAGEERRYYQVGIVSWGIGCGTEGVPGAYADVALVRNWIDQEMDKRNLDISVYQY